jgi:hypothetical protein
MKLFELLTEGYKEVTQKFSQEASPEQVTQAIAVYKDLVQRNQVTGNERNIDWWGKQGWEPFVSFVNEKSQLKSMTQIKRSKNEGNAHVLYEDANWLVVVPLDKDASCFHGKNTDWCTTKPFEPHFEEYFYTKSVTLIYFLQVGTGNKWAMAVYTNGEVEYFDQADNSIEEEDFQNETGIDPQHFIQMIVPGTQVHSKATTARAAYTDLVDKIAEMIYSLPAGTRNETIEKLIFQTKNKDKLGDYLEKAGKADYPMYFQKFMVSYDGTAIRFIENPSEEIQLAAIKENGLAIRYIQNPSEEVQLVAVKKYGTTIQYIQNPSEEVQLAAVKQDGYAIQFIENPSEKVQLAAVKNYGRAIRFIENPSEEIQLAAIKENGLAIRYIQNPSEEVQLVAVKKYGTTIQYIQNPSEEVQLAAVKQDARVIRFIKNPSEKVQLAAVKQDGYVVQFIKNPSDAVKRAAGVA